MLWHPGGGAQPSAPAAKAAAPLPDTAEQAARHIAEVRAQAERQVREARDAGYREGEAAGRRAAEADLRPVVARMTHSLEELALLRPAIVAQAEAELLKLSIAIARRVLHRELSIDPEALAGIVRKALESIHLDEVCRVRVHPADAGALRSGLEKNPAARTVEVQPDGALERGALVVETGRGKLDASVETQLAEIERGLADRLRRHA